MNQSRDRSIIKLTTPSIDKSINQSNTISLDPALISSLSEHLEMVDQKKGDGAGWSMAFFASFHPNSYFWSLLIGS
jgi:hypothetical protein